MKKRVFIGLHLSKQTQSKYIIWRKKYKNQIPVRWMKPEYLHLTLVPPWYEKNISHVAELLKQVKQLPFDLVFQKITYGPNPKKPRLIWAETGESRQAEKVKRKIEKILGQEPEKGRFLPHLTLARFKQSHFGNFKIKILCDAIEWKEEIRAFCLIESILKRKGAEYKTIRKFSFSSK